ncbi:hypothetical protein [Nonomuraea sp. B19D2]|uniref:hypothetical protein n=1 Tax=Nonomuraea sp. B19D2 TaxID=3159561 RepID=UPI0032DA2EA8
MDFHALQGRVQVVDVIAEAAHVVRCSWPTGALLPRAAARPRPPTSAPSPDATACPTRAEYLFKTASAELDPHGDGWTLHQLRHSALTYLAAAGRTTPELQAKSRHQHLASLGRYVRPGRGDLRPHHR